MRARLARFMAGRNGADELSRFVSIVIIVMFVLSLFMHGFMSSILWVLAIAGLIYCYFRMFSKNVTRRREENRRFMNIKVEVRAYFSDVRARRAQRKDYKFFRCPSCRAMLRVPRGKGRIKIVCKKCGTSFVKKT